MKKKSFALLLALTLVMGLLPMQAGAAFSDISDAGTALSAATLQSAGITTGTSATSFSPYQKLTRAQFSAFAVRAMGLEDQVAASAYKALFSDVQPGQWYTGYVNLAYSKGIISGYGNGKFGPNDTVTYGQVVTILLHMLGYTSAEVGKVWPADYVSYAADIGIASGVSCGANDTVNRGQAAVLLCNTLKEEPNGSTKKFFETMSNVASTESGIVLDNNATSGGAAGYLMTCRISGTTTSIEYYGQKNVVSPDLTGCSGSVLLNKNGKVVGFVPDCNEIKDITVSSAKASSITDAKGTVYRISGGANVISSGNLYPYASTGFMQVDAQTGKTARLFYNDDGAVNYVYLSTGSISATTSAAVATTSSPVSQLAHELGLSGGSYVITKNGVRAAASDLAKYDTAYYDAATKTLCASDYRISGCIEAASPSVGAATTITVAGCTMKVLENAWTTLAGFKAGDKVTLLLTDDGKVAAAYSASTVSAPMVGVLATDGKSVTLAGSGLKLTGSTITAAENLYGSLVRVSASANSSLACAAATSGSAGTLDISAKKLGSNGIAPGCAIYEWVGGASRSFVCNLAGTQGISSSDFGKINWTKTLSGSSVSYYHLNDAGQVDVLLLNDVTGNCYQYGAAKRYTGESGFASLGTLGESYTDAVTLANGAGESKKYLCPAIFNDTYIGAALGLHSAGMTRISATAKLTSVTAEKSSFYQEDNDWFATAGDHILPVSDNVQTYIAAAGTWSSGEAGLVAAVSSGAKLTVYYDRTPTTGAQIRVIVVG